MSMEGLFLGGGGGSRILIIYVGVMRRCYMG